YRRPDSFAATVSTSLLGSTLHFEGAHNNFTWLIGARQKTSSYVLKTLDTKGDYKPSFYDVQSFLTWSRELSRSSWEVDLLTSISGNKYFLVPLSRQSDFGTVNQALRLTVYFDGQETDRYQTYLGGLSFINKRGPYKDLILKYIFSAYRANESETYDILGEYSLDELETDFGKSSFGQVKFNIGSGSFLEHARNYLDATVYNAEHKGKKIFAPDTVKRFSQVYEWGVKLQHEEINDHLNEWKMTDSAGYSVPQGNPNTIDLQDVVKNRISLSSNRAMGYVQASWGKMKKDSGEFTLTAGMRGNYWDLNQQFVTGPRATFAWKPHWHQKKNPKKLVDILFKAASGYYYQPPFYREMRDPYGNINRDIKAQTSIHYVLGSDLNFVAWGRNFKFISELYYKQLKNLIPYEIDNVRIRYYATNSANGYATGLDLKVNGEFVKGVDSWISMSVMQTREDIRNDYYVLNYNKEGDLIIPGYTTDDTVARSVTKHPGFIPRPTDQRVNFGLFFQDYIPNFERCKMHMNLIFGSGLPFGPPDYNRYKDTLRMPPYRRVDIGFSYDLLSKKTKWDKTLAEDSVTWVKTKKFWKGFESIWLSMEVYNLLGTNNTISYLWVKDVTDRSYAIPNYLSRRLVNLRMLVKF
ncbi:MAG TPA: TonB-dependent receptor, partial [Bacteroidia bacterium]